MKNHSISESRKIDLVWQEFLDMADSHIAFFSEPDEKKQRLLRAVYDYRTEIFQEKVRVIYGQN